MMTWIVWGGIALFAVFFVIGAIAQQNDAKQFGKGGPIVARFAGAVTLCTLLNHVKRPDFDDAGRIDDHRIFSTTMVSLKQVFAEPPGEDKMMEELKTVVKYGNAYLEKLKEHMLYPAAKKHCTVEKKDEIILAALTALQLNYNLAVDAEANSLRIFAYDFYGSSNEAERRLTGLGGGVNLLELSIQKANEIIRDLNARANPQ